MKDSAYEFACAVDRQIEALSNDEYHRRTGRSKILREELFPLSRLALHLKQPGLEVEVEGFEDCGRADGFIRITGFREQEFEVQITYADYGREDALRAELLVSQEFAPGAGDIRRDKKSGHIVATMEAVDYEEHVGRIAAAVMARFRDKVSKPYAPSTALLIAFDEVKLYGRAYWAQLFTAVDGVGGMGGSPFATVYLFNCATNELHKVPS